MSYVDLSPGDRIRLVMFTAVDTDQVAHRVNLRYSWTDVDPEHVCQPADCDHCASQIRRVLAKRLDRAVTVASVIVLRDKQTTVRDTTPAPAQMVAA